MSATITASEVNKLRQMTGAGMMDCKKALVEANGDFDAAVDYLRKKGQKVSASRADRDATEGAVIAKTTSDNKSGVVIKLSCETDFVAKNDDFVAFANQIADVALSNRPASVEDLLKLQVDGKTIEQAIIDNIGKIGEKIEVAAYETVDAEGVVSYIHAGNKIGVLVGLNKAVNDAIAEAGKDVAMQIAAMNPVALDKDGVDESTIAREIEVGKEQARAEGKPEDMLEKIALGKLNKFYKENTLVNQAFVKDNSKSIAQMLNDVENGLAVTAFKRAELGAN